MTSGWENVGLSGAGTGTFVQTGGINSLTSTGYLALANGTYSLSGTGLLSASGFEKIGYGGVGVFVHTGGINSIASSGALPRLHSLSLGTYSLSGTGLLNVSGAEYIGYSGTGSLVQTGGTHSVAGSICLGSSWGASGVYTLSGGTAYASDLYLGGSSSAAGGTGTLAISGTGSLSVSGTLEVCTPESLINLSGGSLTSVPLVVPSAPQLPMDRWIVDRQRSRRITHRWRHRWHRWQGRRRGSGVSVPSLSPGQTLSVTGTLTLGSGASLVLAGGTLNAGSLSVSSGATLALGGQSLLINTLSGAGAITSTAAGTAILTVGNGSFSGTISDGAPAQPWA